MKKVFCLFLSLMVLMGLSACERETPGNPQKPEPEELPYLTFMSSGESSVALVKVGEPFDISLEYSIDGKSWNLYTIGESIYLLKNEVSFRAGETGNEVFSKGKDDYYQFKISGEIAARGNAMSLLDRNCTRNNVPANAFAFLFKDCQSLTSAPDLPAMNLAASCYYSMFESCTSLTETPTLPATELASGCYSWMFSSCTNLTEAPSLPATRLAEYCYLCMFKGCTSLTRAPELLAKELVKGCYKYMFEKCSNLNYVKALFTDKPSRETTGGWVSGVAPTGTFVKSKDAIWDVRGDNGIPEGWTVESDAGSSDDPQKPNPEEPSYLTFVSSGESTIALIKKGEPFEITLEYSVDGKVWEPYTIGKTVELADGGKLMFRAGEQGNTKFSAGYGDYYRFIISGKVAAKGNVMSLLGRDLKNNTLPYTAFVYLFAGCEGLISAPVLPATQLDVACYYGMFAGCVNLTKAPELPATKLAESCYWQMFAGCKSLTESPALPATELAMMCYYCMFQNCPSLAKTPALPAMKMAASCYLGMFYGCASLTKAPELPATELAQYCYKSMFDGCTNLTKAPELPATVLAEECYSNMFYGCASLTKAPELPATELAKWCYSQMFEGCTNLTKAPVLPATELAKWCYSQMFEGCTNLTKAPVLPAKKLAEYCYSSMFFGCTNLNYVKALFTDEPSDEATNYWLFDVSPNGTFVKSKEVKWDVRGASGIPEGWTVVTE